MNLPYRFGERVRVTSAYGYRTDPITGENGAFHGGIDLVGQGSKLLCSPIGGVVLVSQMITDKTNRTWEWGNYVCISGDDGNLYYLCHMASRTVTVGQRIEAGDSIGVEGSTGYSTGSHCHLEIRDKNNKTLNPADILGIENEAGTVWVVGSAEEEESTPVGDSVPADWSAEAVKWARDNGILKGDENGDLMLRNNATREQIAVMLHRVYELIKSEM
ncbi:MAG: peptidoglycan DD-metalloendopeptidase family protein [Clostridia bacterium]|nr:peptidoglycan DD-metalloendopeptidase family protein [Clostridia bacterium]